MQLRWQQQLLKSLLKEEEHDSSFQECIQRVQEKEMGLSGLRHFI